MNHLIIEGPDNVGKNKLIEQFVKFSPNLMIRHFSKPHGQTKEEQQNYQLETFSFEFRFSTLLSNFSEVSPNKNDILIWNRSHIGEMVYAPLYRNSKGNWVYDLEQTFNFDNRRIFLILLTGDPEFLIRNDDGLSFSTKLEDKQNEIELFKQAVDKSIIKNKMIIKVNEGMKFKPANKIYEEIYKFIHGNNH